MTANTFAEDIARTKEAGMNGHIAKPIDINTVMHVLANLQR
jgi:CheY-like chemotaxis protein